MSRRRIILARAGVLLAAVLLALPLRGALARAPHAARGHTSVASGGAVALAPDADPAGRRATVRQQLAMHGRDTYIGEMLAHRDSSLARWPDRHGAPLRVWVQPATSVAGWTPALGAAARGAFRSWDALALPVRFALAADSAGADVHVTFVDHFDEPISGRTKWTRDDDWWITDADIVLAVHHNGGAPLDAHAMRAMTMHEVGHLLGLDHTADTRSIMAPKVRVRALSAVDRATVRLLYTLPAGGVR